MFKKMFLLLLLAPLVLSSVSQATINSFEDLEKAVVLLSCRTPDGLEDMGGGSGTIIYHKNGSVAVILTAYHVTQGCRSIDGELFYADRDQGIVTYYKVKETLTDIQHDLSIVETKSKIDKYLPTIDISTRYVDYLSPVVAVGYPGPFRNPITMVITVGYVNAPFAPVTVCDMGKLSTQTKKRFFFKNKVKYSNVWECDDKTNPQTSIDVLLNDAEIGPGNSGGALLNDQLELVGVTVAAVKMGNFRPMAVPLKYVVKLIEKSPYASEILKENGSKHQ